MSNDEFLEKVIPVVVEMSIIKLVYEFISDTVKSYWFRAAISKPSQESIRCPNNVVYPVKVKWPKRVLQLSAHVLCLQGRCCYCFCWIDRRPFIRRTSVFRLRHALHNAILNFVLLFFLHSILYREVSVSDATCFFLPVFGYGHESDMANQLGVYNVYILKQ